jgi:hypothetical protein
LPETDASGIFFFNSIRQEIWMRRKTNGKHAWNQGRFSGEVVHGFINSQFLKLFFKVIKDESGFYK